jgi:hypothetical protein
MIMNGVNLLNWSAHQLLSTISDLLCIFESAASARIPIINPSKPRNPETKGIIHQTIHLANFNRPEGQSEGGSDSLKKRPARLTQVRVLCYFMVADMKRGSHEDLVCWLSW